MKVLIAIVLYRCGINESDSIKAITEYIDLHSKSNNVEIHIFDNGEKEQINKSDKLIYHANCKNCYLSENYNKALTYCLNNNVDWLVLLDQDTMCPREYLDIIFNGNLDEKKAAYVPKIQSPDGTKIAPYTIGIGFKKKYKIDNKSKLYSINSATILNVKYFYKNVHNFSDEFPLDFLDHWYFHKINSFGGAISLLDVVIIHNLSVANKTHAVSVDRYESILKSEQKFMYCELKTWDRVFYKFNLIKRYIKWRIKNMPVYANIVKKFIFTKYL